MRLFKIYTENKFYDKTIELMGSYFPNGFTVTIGMGVYGGDKEHSIIIDIVTDNEQHVYDLAWDICKANGQKSVLVFAITGEMKVIQ